MLEFSGATRYVKSSNISLTSTLTSAVLCRTYCYVRYCRREDAETATKQLNNHQIRPGTFLAVTKSVDNRRLCVKTLSSLCLINVIMISINLRFIYRPKIFWLKTFHCEWV